MAGAGGLGGCVAIDARCLQDPDYAGRGVGRHATGLLSHAPRHVDRPLVALVDPLMPPLDARVRALFAAVRPNAQAAELRQPACFVQPSPMTHDPLFVAHLLLSRGTLKASVVHDFIPWEFASHYLAQPAVRHAYITCLRWLQRYDLFLPNSQSSAAALRGILGVADARITVAGAALDPAFDTPRHGQPPRPEHVLVIGGGDPRKNVECAVRAHAGAGRLQAGQVPLVITGSHPPEREEALRALAAAQGGAAHLLRLPGHVDDAALRDLYRHAICVIAPSRAEGFDLPVVEAMASGVPAVVSDIPAHRELVGDGAWRFAPDDHHRLAALIGRLAEDQAMRAKLIAAQQPIWLQHRAAAVAERFWQPIELRLAAAVAPAPAVLRGRRPRLALLSPLPPDRSGVADYTAACCAELGRLTELHVFTDTASPAPPQGAASVRPLSAVPTLSGGFDRVVSVMGNSAYHLGIFQRLLRYGGACIAHDSRMLGFYRQLAMDRATAVASRELGRVVTAAEIEGWLADEASLEALHMGEIAAAADPLLVHSAMTARLLRERYAATPTQLPFCIYRPWQPEQLAAREAARMRLGLPDRQVVIATFGSVHRTKAPVECIWALEILRGWGIDAALHFVGVHAERHGLQALAEKLGLAACVRFLGCYVSEQVYRDYLLAADLGIQLRLTYFGSLSGALLDCVAAGLPTVANASLAGAMDAPDYVRRVPDALSPLLVAEALADLLDLGLARQRPEAARRAYEAAHSFPLYAAQLCHSLGLEAAA
jgi:glycosyltransferase involved in cell wall biosynthesis